MSIKYHAGDEIKAYDNKHTHSQNRPLFEEIQPTLIEEYAQHLALVKEATGIKDERALSAVGYTIWGMIWDEINKVPQYVREGYLDFRNAEVAFHLIRLYPRTSLPMKKRLFVDALLDYGAADGITKEDIFNIMTEEIELGISGFEGVQDYLLLADTVILKHQINTGKITKAKGNKQMKELQAQLVPVTAIDF